MKIFPNAFSVLSFTWGGAEGGEFESKGSLTENDYDIYLHCIEVLCGLPWKVDSRSKAVTKV